MKKGYYTDNQGRCLGGWELNEKPTDTDEYKWFEADAIPAIYQPRTRQNIIFELDEIDRKSIRAIRTNDTVRMEQLEAQAELLREELRNVGT